MRSNDGNDGDGSIKNRTNRPNNPNGTTKFSIQVYFRYFSLFTQANLYKYK